MRETGGRTGFTLIEVMVGSIVFIVIFTGLAFTLQSGIIVSKSVAGSSEITRQFKDGIRIITEGDGDPSFPNAGLLAGDGQRMVSSPTGIGFRARANRGMLTAIDGATNLAVSSIAVGSGTTETFRFMAASHPSELPGLAVSAATNRIYVANPWMDSVAVVDAVTQSCLFCIPVGSGPAGVAVRPGPPVRIYVANSLGNYVSVIDETTNAVVATITVGQAPTGLTYHLPNDRLFVTNGFSNSVSVIDCSANTLIAGVFVGRRPIGIDCDATTNRVYAANNLGNSVSVIDANANTLLSTISLGTGRGPVGVSVNSSIPKIYIANNISQTVSVIDGGTGALDSDLVPTPSRQFRPTGLAFHPALGWVYVSDALGWVTNIDCGDPAPDKLDKPPGQFPIAEGVGGQPAGIAHNPVDGDCYLLNRTDFSLSRVSGNAAWNTIPFGAKPGMAFNPLLSRLYLADPRSKQVGVVDLLTNDFIAPISLATAPAGICVSPGGTRIYVADQAADLLKVFDANTHGLVASIPVGRLPGPVAFLSPNKIYVANLSGKSVSVIDAGTNSALGLPIAVDTLPVALAANSTTNRVYVANLGSDTISVIDAVGDTVTSIIDLDTSFGANDYAPGCLAANTVTNRIYVGNRKTGRVMVIDGATEGLIADVPLGGGIPLEIQVNEATDRVFVTLGGDLPAGNSVVEIDGSTNTVVRSAFVGCMPFGSALDATASTLYSFNTGNGTVSVIDGTTCAVRATLPRWTHPAGMAINSVTNRAYLVNPDQSTVSAVDLATNQTVATISVASFPCGIAVNETSNRVFVTHVNSGSLSVIDGATNVAVATSSGGSRPAGIGVNPNTNRIYVANLDSECVAVIQDGSLALLNRVGVGPAPTGIAVNSVTNKVYVTIQGDETVSVLDGSDILTTKISAGLLPCEVVVNETSNRVYVTNRTSETCSVIDGGTDTIIASFAVDGTPSVLALNRATGNLYLANVGSDTISVRDGAGTIVADLLVGAQPSGISCNPTTNRVFVTNSSLWFLMFYQNGQIFMQRHSFPGAWPGVALGPAFAIMGEPPYPPGSPTLRVMVATPTVGLPLFVPQPNLLTPSGIRLSFFLFQDLNANQVADVEETGATFSTFIKFRNSEP